MNVVTSSPIPAATPSAAARPYEQNVVTVCRTCGTAIYLAHKSDGPQVGGTGPDASEHWRHIVEDERYCERGNGAIAEPYDGGGPVAERLRILLASRTETV